MFLGHFEVVYLPVYRAYFWALPVDWGVRGVAVTGCLRLLVSLARYLVVFF